MSDIGVTYIDHMGSDLSVVNAARVSFKKYSTWENVDRLIEYPGVEPILKDKDVRLIRYLARHKHISPFGHCFASFHVKAPIFVARQLVKHKFLRWNEVSRRYVDDPPEFYSPEGWRMRSQDKKQGSSEKVLEDKDPEIRLAYDGWGSPEFAVYSEVLNSLYENLIEKGVAPEQARMVLPHSTMTEWIWSGSLDAFADMVRLRSKEDTQFETRKVANIIAYKMSSIFPVSWGALMDEYGKGDTA